MKRIIGIALLLLSSPLLAEVSLGEISAEEVIYQAGNTSLHGYLAHDPQITGKRPGVLVVHEWWGHNEYARERARMLAELGYVALAVDMYGGGQLAEHPQEAGAFAGYVRNNMPLAQERFEAALAVLRDHPGVDPERIAAIGYCFGGQIVLDMARAGLDLSAVASFHGALATKTPAQPGTIQPRILVLHGSEDPMIPQEQVLNFIDEMEHAEADYRFIAYPGATHSFTNPEADRFAAEFGMPIGYHPEADQASWQELYQFLRETFRRTSAE